MLLTIKCCFNLFCLLSIFLISTVDAQVCTPAPVGLVSWWFGDGNALDARSRNNGSLLNGATFAAGHVGQAFSFNSSPASISVLDDPNFNAQVFTISGWIRTAGIVDGSPGAFIAAKSGTTAFFGYDFLLTTPQQGGRIRLTLNGGVGGSDLFGTTSVTDNVFHHVAASYDGTTMRIYLDGVLDAQLNIATTINYEANSPFIIGRRQWLPAIGETFPGLIDELAFFNRSLSLEEIAAIHAAGTAGKCKPTATVAPSGVVGWWSGDGDANDISGFDNDGGLFNGAGHDIGRVGQAFSFDGVDDVVRIGNQAEHNVQTGNFSLEAWVNLRNYAVGSSFIAGKELCAGPSIYAMYVSNGGAPSMRLNNSSSTSFFASGPVGGVGLNQWHHLVGTREGNTLRMYLDGVEVGSTALSGSFDAQGASFSIGERPDGLAESCRSLTNGLIDEVTLYDRALGSDEVESIFNAGAGGKLKTVDTPSGFAEVGDSKVFNNDKPVSYGGVVTQVGDVTLTFDEVTTGGTTQQIPLSGVGLPPLPFNPATSIIYDIATSAVFSGNVGLCFNLPTFTLPGQFAGLRVYHLENGNWTNRTTTRDFATRTLCAETTSLSPFAVGFFAPTSAPVSVGGRVVTATGNPIRGAAISIIDAATGETSRSITSSFGYYRFDGLAAGQTYILEVRSGRHSFQTPVRTVTAVDDIADLDFIADALFSPPGFKGSP